MKVGFANDSEFCPCEFVDIVIASKSVQCLLITNHVMCSNRFNNNVSAFNPNAAHFCCLIPFRVRRSSHIKIFFFWLCWFCSSSWTNCGNGSRRWLAITVLELEDDCFVRFLWWIKFIFHTLPDTSNCMFAAIDRITIDLATLFLNFVVDFNLRTAAGTSGSWFVGESQSRKHEIKFFKMPQDNVSLLMKLD